MKYWFLVSLLCIISFRSHAQNQTVVDAKEFIAQLEQNQKAKTVFNFSSAERFNWHFVPRERLGISFHSLSKSQREAAYNLLKSSLSSQDIQKLLALWHWKMYYGK
nr:DUF3500 domain-containing protein [Pseudochryseolinea flava]